jgi:diaminopimelate decarboxylase
LPDPNIAGLLEVARELGLDLAGVSFHVGSGASNPDALPEGIAAAAAVFARAAEQGFAMRVLDIGGGFPGGEQLCFLGPRCIHCRLCLLTHLACRCAST